jgi:hypothetical protein
VKEILNWLRGILSDEASAKISSETLQNVYCFIGLIHKWQGQREDALKAMVLAAWLAQRTSSNGVGKEPQPLLNKGSRERP